MKSLIGVLFLLSGYSFAQNHTEIITHSRGSTAALVPESGPNRIILFLHGAFEDGSAYVDRSGIKNLALNSGAVLIAPNARNIGLFGSRAWSAVYPVLDSRGDSGFLREILEKAMSRFEISRERVAVMGHSSGGFMAQQLTCQHADLIGTLVSISAGRYRDLPCNPSHPVRALTIHGGWDIFVPVGGGWMIGAFGYLGIFLGAEATAREWASDSGCDAQAVSKGNLDFDGFAWGAETQATEFPNCDEGGASELWISQGAGHVLYPSRGGARKLLDFVLGQTN